MKNRGVIKTEAKQLPLPENTLIFAAFGFSYYCNDNGHTHTKKTKQQQTKMAATQG